MRSTRKNIFFSASPRETAKLAQLVARIAAGQNSPNAFVVALSGNLGTGKTVFTQALLKAFGVNDTVASPTFVLSREYILKKGRFKKAYHIDVYRLSAKEACVLELRRIIKEKHALVLIEWAEKIKKIIPQNALWIYFKHGKKIHERRIEIRNS